MDRIRGLHAQQHLMRVMVVFAQVVAVVGGYQRDAQLPFQLEQVGMDLLLKFQPLVLDLEKKISLSRKYPGTGRQSLLAAS